MRTLKKLFFVVFCFSLLFTVKISKAQEDVEESPLSISAEFVSSYVWRGMYSDQTPSIQPLVTYSLKNFTIGTFGSTDFTGAYKEFDIFAGYSFGSISTTIYDYYWGTNDYFDYTNSATEHIFEFELLFQPESIPLRVSASSFFYGADKKATYDATETNLTKNNYSTYFEAGYTFDLKGNSLYTFVGATPFHGFYSDASPLMNIGLKASRQIPVTESFSIPIQTTICFNPATKSFFCLFGVSL